MIEIGPGRGALTAHLLPRAGRLIAVEIDSALAAALPAAPNLEVVRADALELDLAAWGPVVVTGNLPYYAATPILEKTLALGPLLRRAVFLVQREVALRLAAAPGTRDYGLLSVRTQLFAEPRILFSVPPEAFQPPPKVDSSVVLLTPRDRTAELRLDDTGRFLAFAGRCFRQKRKTLRNNLAGVYGHGAIEGLPEASLRAEQLSLEELASIYRRIPFA